VTENREDDPFEPAQDDSFDGYRSVREEMRERFPPSDVQKSLDALIRSRTSSPPRDLNALVQSSLTFLHEMGFLEAWRTNPLCVRCGLPGDLGIVYTDVPGVFCSLCGIDLQPERRSRPLLSWLVDVMPRMRPRRHRGRPRGSGRAIPDEEFPSRHEGAVSALRKRGVEPTDERVAAELAIHRSTLQEYRKRLGIPPQT